MRERWDELWGSFIPRAGVSRLMRPSEEADIDACGHVRWVRAGRLDMRI